MAGMLAGFILGLIIILTVMFNADCARSREDEYPLCLALPIFILVLSVLLGYLVFGS